MYQLKDVSVSFKGSGRHKYSKVSIPARERPVKAHECGRGWKTGRHLGRPRGWKGLGDPTNEMTPLTARGL